MKDRSENRSLRISSSVRITETQDGAVLLDVKQGLCFSINPVGTVIWKRVNEGWPVTDVMRYLAETFSISLDQARDDTQEFLDVLLEKRLVEMGNGGRTTGNRLSRISGLLAGLAKLRRAGRTRKQE